MVTFRRAFWISLTACSWGSLATEGTRTSPGPFETSSVTTEPTSASSPGLGSCSTTWSNGWLLRTRVCRTSKPDRSSSARAEISCLPVARGTSRVSGSSTPLSNR